MGTTQSTVTLPESVVRVAKRLAKREKRSMGDVLSDALTQYEASRPSKRPETVEEWARFIEEAKKTPYTQEELRADWKRLAKFGAAQAERLGIKTERDVLRICDEHRASRRNASVVLDTNTLVAGFHKPSGRYAGIWRAALERRFLLLHSPALAAEVCRRHA